MMDTVLRNDVDGIATLTFNRPEKLNALNGEIFEQLDAHLHAIAADTERVGVVVLRGAGKCFSAGLDLVDIANGIQIVTPLFKSRTIDRLSALPQPVIAAVHGHCFTGALEVALAADIIFAAESANFSDTHSKWGLTPGGGMSQRLPRRIGRGHASRMMFSGLAVAASEGLSIGLVDFCVPDPIFDREVATFAAITANSWFSNRANKQMMLETDGLPLAAGLSYEFFRRAGRAPDFERRAARFKR